jgi:hypothetical protein
MAESGTGGAPSLSLKVDIDKLSAYGTYLTNAKTSLDTQLEGLRAAFAAVNNAWKDHNGTDLVTGFGVFIDKAKPLCDELESLGTYATTESGKYKDILARAKASLSG